MNRRRQAECRRLLKASERIGRRREWWIAQRDAAIVRLNGLDRETAAAEAAIAELDRLEAAP